MRSTTTWNGLHPRLCLNSSRKHVLHPLHIVMIREVFLSVSSSRFVARLAAVQALCSLTNQVHELHCLDEIGVSHQVFLSAQFTLLYFVMMSCNTSHTSLLPSKGTKNSIVSHLTADTRLALTSETEWSPRQDHQPARTWLCTDVTPRLPSPSRTTRPVVSWRDPLMS